MINSNTQAGRLLVHFIAGKSITSLKAYEELGITQLGARIDDLMNSGFKIEKKWITVTNRFNEDIRVVEYSLEQEKVAA